MQPRTCVRILTFVVGVLACASSACGQTISFERNSVAVQTGQEVDLKAVVPGVDPRSVHWLINGVEGLTTSSSTLVPDPLAFQPNYVGTLRIVSQNATDRQGDGGQFRSTVVSLRYTAPKNTKVVSSVTVTAFSDNPAIQPGSMLVVITNPTAPGYISAGSKRSNLTSIPIEEGKKKKLTLYDAAGNAQNDAIWRPAESSAGTVKADAGKATATFEASEHNSPPAPAAYSTVVTAQSPTIEASVNVTVLRRLFYRCSSQPSSTKADCVVRRFNRLKDEIQTVDAQGRQMMSPVTNSTDPAFVTAINAAKTLFSGSVLILDLTPYQAGSVCGNYDWKLAVQSEESAGIMIYDPSDVGSGVCDGGRFILALPVHVVWAEVYGYPQSLDPTRGAPAKPSSFTDCMGSPAAATIKPCDKDFAWNQTILYGFNDVVNRFTLPGNGQGSINFSGKGEVSFDAQTDLAIKAGKGWLNAPVVFERGATNANLNTLTFSLAYDWRWFTHPDITKFESPKGLIFRMPQLQVRSGAEYSPSRPAPGVAPTQATDWNYVNGETARFPIVLNFHSQPSSWTSYPVVGLEEGWHLSSNLHQSDPILRGVVGADGSFRWPFNITHNFLGTTPIGFEAQYRYRMPLFKEPYANFGDLPSAGMPCPDKPGLGPSPSGGCMPKLVLSSIPRSFFKGDMTVPINPYIQIKFSAYRGSLPPDFWNVGMSYTLGLSFGNPASSEH